MLKKLFLLIIFIVVLTFTLNAKSYKIVLDIGEQVISEDSLVTPFSLSAGVDIVNRYIWRGVEFGVDQNGSSTPHIQPTACLTYSFSNSSSISFGVWGSYGFNGNYSESDLYLNAFVPTELLDVSVTFNDYYYPFVQIPFNDFNSKGAGAHTIDAQLAVSLKSFLPINFLISTNIFNELPDNNSLYLECGYSLNISNTTLGLFAGVAKGHSVWHSVQTDKLEFVNVGFKVSKSIKFTEDYSLPVGMQWIYNHHLKKTYLVFKVTI